MDANSASGRVSVGSRRPSASFRRVSAFVCIRRIPYMRLSPTFRKLWQEQMVIRPERGVQRTPLHGQSRVKPPAWRVLLPDYLSTRKNLNKNRYIPGKEVCAEAGARHHIRRLSPPRVADLTEPEMIAETSATALYCWRSCPEPSRPEHFPPFSALRTSRVMARANAFEG